MSTCNHPRGNTTITPGSLVIGSEYILEVPGCVCASMYAIGFESYAFVVIHDEDGKTMIKRINCKNGDEKIFLKEEGLVDIINIFLDSYLNNTALCFTTIEGIKYIFTYDGKMLPTEEMCKRYGPNIVGRMFDGRVSCDGHVGKRYVTGYNHSCSWSDNIVSIYGRSLTFKNDVDYACGKIAPSGAKVIFALSEGKISYNVISNDGSYSTEIEGEWTHIIVHKDIVYGVDEYGITRDLRCVWKKYCNAYYEEVTREIPIVDVPREMLYSTDVSPYELGDYECETIGVLHGMRLTRKPIKGAHTAEE